MMFEIPSSAANGMNWMQGNRRTTTQVQPTTKAEDKNVSGSDDDWADNGHSYLIYDPSTWTPKTDKGWGKGNDNGQPYDKKNATTFWNTYVTLDPEGAAKRYEELSDGLSTSSNKYKNMTNAYNSALEKVKYAQEHPDENLAKVTQTGLPGINSGATQYYNSSLSYNNIQTTYDNEKRLDAVLERLDDEQYDSTITEQVTRTKESPEGYSFRRNAEPYQLTSIPRIVGTWMVELLYRITNYMEDEIFENALNSIDFLGYLKGNADDFIFGGRKGVVVIAFMATGFIALGFWLIFRRDEWGQRRRDILQHIVAVALIIVMLPTLLVALGSLTKLEADATLGKAGRAATSQADEIVRRNSIDWLYILNRGMLSPDLQGTVYVDTLTDSKGDIYYMPQSALLRGMDSLNTDEVISKKTIENYSPIDVEYFERTAKKASNSEDNTTYKGIANSEKVEKIVSQIEEYLDNTPETDKAIDPQYISDYDDAVILLTTTAENKEASDSDILEMALLGRNPWYRYSFNFVPMIVQLFFLALVYLLLAYKILRLIMELFVSGIIAPFVAAVDYHSSGQKTKELLKYIAAIYGTLLFLPILIKIFELGNAYITATWANTGHKGFVALITIAWSMAVIDGPNIIQRLLGIDAGLKSAWGVMAAFGGTALKLGSAGTKMVKKAGAAAISGTAGAIGGAEKAKAKILEGSGKESQLGEETEEKKEKKENKSLDTPEIKEEKNELQQENFVPKMDKELSEKAFGDESHEDSIEDKATKVEEKKEEKSSIADTVKAGGLAGALAGVVQRFGGRAGVQESIATQTNDLNMDEARHRSLKSATGKLKTAMGGAMQHPGVRGVTRIQGQSPGIADASVLADSIVSQIESATGGFVDNNQKQAVHQKLVSAHNQGYAQYMADNGIDLATNTVAAAQGDPVAIDNHIAASQAGRAAMLDSMVDTSDYGLAATITSYSGTPGDTPHSDIAAVEHITESGGTPVRTRNLGGLQRTAEPVVQKSETVAAELSARSIVQPMPGTAKQQARRVKTTVIQHAQQSGATSFETIAAGGYASGAQRASAIIDGVREEGALMYAAKTPIRKMQGIKALAEDPIDEQMRRDAPGIADQVSSGVVYALGDILQDSAKRSQLEEVIEKTKGGNS